MSCALRAATLVGGETERGGEADGAGDVLGAGAAVALLRAADDLRGERRAASHVQRADALRAVDLVRGDREQVDAERIDVEVERAGGLHGVGVDGDARVVRLDDARDLGDRLDRADLVVGVHDADEDGAIVERVAERVEVDEAFAVDGQVGDAEALLLERGALVQDGVVLDGGGDDVIAVGRGWRSRRRGGRGCRLRCRRW